MNSETKQFYQNLSNKATYSLPKKKQIKVKENALVRLKYIHDRILDHMNLKNFLEIHQVNQFLNQINRLITNVDEIEVYRKKVKNMLLTVNDSIMEFGQAISSGEITFNSVQSYRESKTINKKTSLNSSGLSTLGESSSLSSLALTNYNFQTLPNNNSGGYTLPREPTNAKKLSFSPSSMISSNKEFLSLNNFEHSRIYHSQQVTSIQNEVSSDSCLNELQKSYGVNSYVQPKGNNESSVNTTSIFSSLELTNNDFKTLSNNCTIENYNTQEKNSSLHDTNNCRIMSPMEVIVSPDLFIQPLPISKRKLKFKQKPHVNTKTNTQKKNDTKEHVHNPDFIISNYDHVENFNRLSLERSENNKIMECFTQPPMMNEEKSGFEDSQIPSNAEKISNYLMNDIESEQMSDTSEIYIFNDLNSLQNVESEKENNNVVVYNGDYEMCNETKQNNDSHNLVEKQFVTAPIHTSTFNIDHTIQKYSREKTKDLKKYNITISENKSCFSNSLNETKQSEINLDPSNISPNQGVKRRFLDSSTDLKMINGNIISNTENIHVSIENYPIACSDEISLSTSESIISCNKTFDELSKELQEATNECSQVWNDFLNLLDETKKELMKSKNTSMPEYNIGKLKFPPGYEDHYKYLEDLLFEFKSTIGVPNNIKQAENTIISFEDIMNDWGELQQIVQKITKREKKKKNFNCTLRNNKV